MRLSLWCLLLLVACVPQVVPVDDGLEHGDVCRVGPYADDIGLAAGQRGQVISWQFGTDLYESPLPRDTVIGHLEPGEHFVVLDGPACWHAQQTSNNRVDHRFWRVRSESRGVEGWLEEYHWGLLTSNRYTVQPLTGDDPGIEVGTALAEPLRFEGQLEWTPIGGPLEPRDKIYRITFADYGYITIEIQVDDPALVDPNWFSGPIPCRVIGLLLPGMYPYREIIGTQMSISGSEVQKLWVEPREYEVEVSLRYIFGNEASDPSDLTCPDTHYTLLVAPAS